MRKRRKSIRTRLSYSFMSIIIISIFIFIFMVSLFLKQYYYKGVEDILTDQVNMSVNLYSQYFIDSSLQDNVMDNVDAFWRFSSAQVQIIDNRGRVLMDSIGMDFTDELDTPDVKRAMMGEWGKWIGRMPYTGEMAMSVAQPLKSNGDIIGVLRFITSLTPINGQLEGIIRVFMLIGILAVGISGIISFVLANGVVGPIKQVTKVAEEMAKGDFDVRSTEKTHDEIGRLSSTLNYMADEITKKERVKNEFLASVSHELRTPLTSIKGWAIILNDTENKEEKIFRDGLKIIEKETERLSGMVEELLDFSKLLSGNISLKLVETDIERLIEYIKQHMMPIAKRNKITFRVECPDKLPCIVVDSNRIKQVLINVLDNAFKFTSQGGNVRLAAYGAGDDLVMEIEDDGCGISPEELPSVKEKFYKGKTGKSSSGIGLSVAYEIVKKHQGGLDIESRPGMGTRVYIRLPIAHGTGRN
ncbi:MAG TPA: ATP-binding protein [Clostridia bacterium]|nr:ATP-binding protein [Clostridia bacterium]